MANTKSAKKRARQSVKRKTRNRAHRSTMRTAIKELRSVVASGETRKAQELLPKTLGVVDSMATKGLIHRNAAARTKSRLTLAVNKLG